MKKLNLFVGLALLIIGVILVWDSPIIDIFMGLLDVIL
ncbi:hypothetical protein C7959_13049 [Orenia marismortui]|uniref:Uncharacterized protein n=1 Tax=Orenia marismortui TaxID=46469 RepID=A0A4R8GR55_9FIRM|nr:hypothetical protein C7959_13049 [Orenia marismortui]